MINASKLIAVLETFLPIGANPRMSCGYATLEHPAALSHTLKHVSGSAQATCSFYKDKILNKIQNVR